MIASADVDNSLTNLVFKGLQLIFGQEPTKHRARGIRRACLVLRAFWNGLVHKFTA